jgi:hypothetical protein
VNLPVVAEQAQQPGCVKVKVAVRIPFSEKLELEAPEVATMSAQQLKELAAKTETSHVQLKKSNSVNKEENKLPKKGCKRS